MAAEKELKITMTDHEKWVLLAGMHDIIYRIEGKDYYFDDSDKDFLYVCAPSEKWGCDLTYRFKVDKKTMKIVDKALYWPEPKED